MITSARARRIATAAAATVLALSTVAVAGPANADSRTLKDGKGDTWNVSGSEPKKASGHPEGDVRKVVVKHTGRKLVVSVHTQNLKKSGSGVGATMQVKAAGGGQYDSAVYGEPGSWNGNSYFSGSEGVNCDTDETMNYKKDVMTLSVPTRCFGRPDWVKVNVSGIWVSSSEKLFFDSASSRKAQGDFTRRIAAG